MEAIDSRTPVKSHPVFTQDEIKKMESLFNEGGEGTLSPEFCHELAKKFNCSISRAEKFPVNWEQVQIWFHDKFAENPSKIPSSPNGGLANASKALIPIPSNARASSDMPGDERYGLSELSFEARSSRDLAWYDVAMFLSYRVLSTGELEARVRFAGFGSSDDEWVNVKRGIRERSIPLEPNECHLVKVGDLVLCFQEREDQANYYDARVMEVHRTVHDIKGCRCIFLVRYDHDRTEENVGCRRLCRRPNSFLGAK